MARKGSKKKVRVRTAQAKQTSSGQAGKTAKEVTLLGHALRSLGGMGGAAVGGYLGNPAVGANVGSSLGAAISRWLGSGDYSVSQNSIVAKASNSIPSMHKTGQSIVVRHKEFLCEVVSASNFTVQRSFTLNPGLVGTFPWLSRLASSYQEYHIRGMVFHYVPTSGSAVSSSNNALGSVLLSTSYRSNDSPPGSKVEMLNEYWACESVPSETFAHPIECSPAENPYNIHYVRSGPVPSGDNQLLYDIGTTHLCVSGCQAAGNVLGDLWVTYEVEFKKPIMDSNVTQAAGWGAQMNVALPPVGSAFPSVAVTASVGNVPITGQNNVITIPVGYFGSFTFHLMFAPGGAYTGWTMTGSPTVSNCTLAPLCNGGSSTINVASFSNASGNTGSISYYAFAVVKPNRDVSATITVPSFSATTGTVANMYMLMQGTTD